MSEKQRAGMTAGKWVVRSGVDEYFITGRIGSRWGARCIAVVNKCQNAPERAHEAEANAKAIAALPELIEALRDIVGMAAIWQLDLDKSPNTMNVAFESARKALAKAGVGGAE